MELLTKNDYLLIGKKVRQIILNRTAKGKGLNGTFESYDSDYSLENGSSVDLRVTGKMLDGLTVEAIKEGVAIATTGTPYASHVNKRRPFLGLTQEEIESTLVPFITSLIEKNLEKVMKPTDTTVRL